MPRTKPQEIAPSSSSSVRWEDVAGVEEAGRAARGRGVHARPEALQEARREGPEGHPPARPARHRQDSARQGGGARVERQVLRPVGLVVRRDVRRPRRRAYPAAVPPGAQGSAGDRLHRRARRRGRHARQRHRGREGPDAEPAARGTRRLRRGRQRRRHRRFQPARQARPGSASPGRFDRQILSRRPTSRAPQHPLGAHPRQAAGGRRGHGGRGAPDERHDRRRPGEHLQRGGDLRRARPPRPTGDQGLSAAPSIVAACSRGA